MHMQRGEVRNPIVILVLTYVTCSIYALIWTWQVVKEVNSGLGRQEFNFATELVLSILTCGLWGLWFQWRLCHAVVELQRRWGVAVEFDPALLMVFSILGVGPFFMQTGLNRVWTEGTPA